MKRPLKYFLTGPRVLVDDAIKSKDAGKIAKFLIGSKVFVKQMSEKLANIDKGLSGSRVYIEEAADEIEKLTKIFLYDTDGNAVYSVETEREDIVLGIRNGFPVAVAESTGSMNGDTCTLVQIDVPAGGQTASTINALLTDITFKFVGTTDNLTLIRLPTAGDKYPVNLTLESQPQVNRFDDYTWTGANTFTTP